MSCDPRRAQPVVDHAARRRRRARAPRARRRSAGRPRRRRRCSSRRGSSAARPRWRRATPGSSRGVAQQPDGVAVGARRAGRPSNARSAATIAGRSGFRVGGIEELCTIGPTWSKANALDGVAAEAFARARCTAARLRAPVADSACWHPRRRWRIIRGCHDPPAALRPVPHAIDSAASPCRDAPTTRPGTAPGLSGPRLPVRGIPHVPLIATPRSVARGSDACRSNRRRSRGCLRENPRTFPD